MVEHRGDAGGGESNRDRAGLLQTQTDFRKMNRKQLIILLTLAAIVGGAGVVVYQKQNASRQSGNSGIGQKLLGDFPVNDVTHLAIRRGANEVNLIRKDDQWRVRERSDYPANFP